MYQICMLGPHKAGKTSILNNINVRRNNNTVFHDLIFRVSNLSPPQKQLLDVTM